MEIGREEAVYLMAFMMAGADGSVSTHEEHAIAARLRERGLRITDPEATQLRQSAMDAWGSSQEAWKAIAKVLGERAERVDAFTMALDVVLADDDLDPGEMAEVQDMADHLDIDRGLMSKLLEERA